MQWLILAAVAYYFYTHGGLSALGTLGQRPIQDTKIQQALPGGFTVGLPIPPGWRVWRLGDGSQVIIQPGAATSPGGWVQGEHNGMLVWFNEQTGEMR